MALALSCTTCSNSHGIPVVFAVTQLALVIKFNEPGPSDNIHCDATGPKLWSDV
jgi:hypothetical protein